MTASADPAHEAAAPTVTPAVQEVVTLIEYALGDLDSGKPADAETVLRTALARARAASADPAHETAVRIPRCIDVGHRGYGGSLTDCPDHWPSRASADPAHQRDEDTDETGERA
jgi:hypothetical protein